MLCKNEKMRARPKRENEYASTLGVHFGHEMFIFDDSDGEENFEDNDKGKPNTPGSSIILLELLDE